MLALDKDMKQILYNSGTFLETEYISSRYAIELLSSFTNVKSIISKSYVLLASNNKVITNFGIQDMNYFYQKNYIYEKYPLSFWENPILENKNFAMLPPTIARYNNTSEIIIPFVQQSIGGSKVENPLIIDIDQKELNHLLDASTMIENSIIIAADEDGVIYAHTSNYPQEMNISALFMTKIQENPNDYFTYPFNDQEYTVVAYTMDSYIKTLNYIALIPTSNYDNKISSLRINTYTIIFLGILISLIFSFFMSRSIYNPLKKIMNIFWLPSNEETKSADMRDEFQYLNHKISNILSNNSVLSSKLSETLPLVHEQYLFKLMNENNEVMQEKYARNLSDFGFQFKYSFFAVSVTNIIYTDYFYEKFSKAEQQHFLENVIKLLTACFPKEYSIYPLVHEKDRLFLITNMEDRVSEASIVEIIQKFHNSFEGHKLWTKLYTGVGTIHESLLGLNQSYNEAVYANTQLSPMNDKSVQLYTSTKNEKSYVLSFEQANKLYNFLSSGYRDEVESLFAKIIEDNMYAKTDEEDLRELYIYIYNIGTGVLSKKFILPEDLMGDSYIDIEAESHNLSMQKLSEYLMAFLISVSGTENMKKSKIEIPEIVAHIKSNFHQDIYLDQYAKQYNTTSKYLAQCFKEYTGTSFSDYLSLIRIEKAKLLLKETDKNIADIQLEVGFNNRYTFIKTFKKHEGITPSEFRNIHSK